MTKLKQMSSGETYPTKDDVHHRTEQKDAVYATGGEKSPTVIPSS